MNDAIEPEAKPKRHKPFGRPGLPRLPGLDLRSHQGRVFRRVYRSLIAEFGEQHVKTVRELAGVRAALEQCQAEILSGISPEWQRSRAREQLPALSRLADKLRARLEATKPPPPAEQSTTDLASILRRHGAAEPVGARKQAEGACVHCPRRSERAYGLP